MIAQTHATLLAGFLLASLCAERKVQDSSPAPPVQQQTEARQHRANTHAEVIDKELIPDFAEVTPTLYRGAQPRKHGFEALASSGIQIVVDLRGDRDGERKEATRL